MQQITDESEDETADDIYVSEDEEIELSVSLDTVASGVGIQGFGLVCQGNIVNAGAPSYTVHPFPCGPDPEPEQDLNLSELQLELPGLLAYVELECTSNTDSFGSARLDCPSAPSSNLEFAADILEEYAKYPPDVKLFVKLSNGQLMLVRNVKIPRVDKTAPADPDHVEVGASATDSQGPGAVYLDWSDRGDPVSDDPTVDGSGIDRFAIKYRIDGGTWSDETEQSADEQWTFSKDEAGLEAGDVVEFSIASIDAVGHRSSAATASAVTEAVEQSKPDDAPSDPSLVADVAYAPDNAGMPKTLLLGAWKPAKSRRHDEISISVELFPESVDQGEPGPAIHTASTSCRRAKSCEIERYYAYEAGTYVTRTTVEIDDGGPVDTRIVWSAPTTLVELSPADEAGKDMSGEPVADESSGASIAITEKYKVCDKGIPAPTKSGYQWNSTKASLWWPSKYLCRWGYSVNGAARAVDETGKPTGHIVDSGVEMSYAKLSDSEKRPKVFAKKGIRTFYFKNEKNHKGYPLFDSLGYTRAWVEVKNKLFWMYQVTDPMTSDLQTDQRFGNKFLPALTKLQGKACYRMNEAASTPLGLGAIRKSDDVSLIVFDFNPEALAIRLFISNNALIVKDKKALLKPRVGCGNKHGVSGMEPLPIQSPGILPGVPARYDFTFKEGVDSRSDNYKQGKTYSTYNPKAGFDLMYAPINTNTVHKGGVSRGSFPYLRTKFRIHGVTGYCDKNAFTKDYDTRVNLQGGTGGKYSVFKMTQQDGMRWAYGQYIYQREDGEWVDTLMYGWLPFTALGSQYVVGSPDGHAEDTLRCRYEPIATG